MKIQLNLCFILKLISNQKRIYSYYLYINFYSMREKGREKKDWCVTLYLFFVLVVREIFCLLMLCGLQIPSLTNWVPASFSNTHTHQNTNTNVENSLKEFNWFVTSLQLDFINNNYTYKFAYIQPARSSFFKNNLCTGNTALEFIVTV